MTMLYNQLASEKVALNREKSLLEEKLKKKKISYT